MCHPNHQAYLLQELANEIRTLLQRAVRKEGLITVPIAVEEGLHEAFEHWMGYESEGQSPLGELWTNRRPGGDLERLAGLLQERARALWLDDFESTWPENAEPQTGFESLEDTCAQYPDVASSSIRLFRLLAAFSEVRRAGVHPADLCVHSEDFAELAERLRR